MAITSQKVLRMVFTTVGGKAFTITLPQPKAGLTLAQVGTVMDLIMAKNIFATSSGDLASKRDIKVVDTTTDDLFDPPQE
ncbi:MULTISPECIES: DUF2922 domain-containing protein [Dehalobacter]|jgi:hypothetical protein|uniref:DUF2922 family protein n=3 Tax=Dehalobacter TaxID=56112 RepID=A0A857DHX3_9FIRM|nr:MULTISPECIES: DUF2922 domain-containing protein [Dehalobacter]AFV03464.1 hypothetical protein DHBDCA_p2437 [Dehalobacter sp. DCA]AFV06451.1 hypothetical protein DCF50_p2448 [Dehalobacter sp. CF]AHF09290.1 hypothetical protein DEHRE_03605 [Dehalobacter restrictus DSM 9455]MCG1025260.1 DUF2922 domain-containing protein [Dehalobacter sp.]MDJ0305851.1 DUF2922 domain-containing protein [Dehalobacter sp.]